jgi:hypothetical protein
MLTEKQLKEFVERYKCVYWDTSKATGTWELPHIPADKEDEHIRKWKQYLTMLIWPRRSKRKYIHKWWREDTWLGKVFEELWLCYWPVVDKK